MIGIKLLSLVDETIDYTINRICVKIEIQTSGANWNLGFYPLLNLYFTNATYMMHMYIDKK